MKSFKVIKETVTTRWSGIDYFEDVLLVVTIPAEFPEKSKAIMRICVYNAGLIKEECSTNLQFTTERKHLKSIYLISNLDISLFISFIYLFFKLKLQPYIAWKIISKNRLLDNQEVCLKLN